jgi:hypothetical protein
MFSHLGSTADHGERAGYNLFPVAIRFFDLLRSTIRFFYPQRDAEATIGIPEITTIFSQLQEEATSFRGSHRTLRTMP